jgi:ABC-2 type transport system ATP-binding protein
MRRISLRHTAGRGYGAGMTAGSYAIDMRNVCKTFGKVTALDHVTMQVPTGGVFGYIGPNGAGKTTTLRILLDLVRADSGSVRVLGRDPRIDGARIRTQVGYLPGELTLWPRMSAREALRRLASTRGLHDLSHAEELAERFALTLDRQVGELSKGNRQKIGIIQAFMHRPLLLLLDEPTSGLDPLMQRTFYELVRDTCDAGATVVVSSHVLSEVDRIAHRVGIIREGSIVAVDDISHLTRSMVTVITAHFPAAVDPLIFAAIEGVRVDPQLDSHEVRMHVHDNLPVALRALADHEAAGIQAQRGDLEQLFMQFYAAPETPDLSPTEPTPKLDGVTAAQPHDEEEARPAPTEGTT